MTPEAAATEAAPALAPEPTKPKKGDPNPLLRALYDCQREALTVPAATTKTVRDGAKTIDTTYAGSEDALLVCRDLLLRHQIMATPLETDIDERRVMTIVVELLHVPSGRRLRRKYKVEIGEYGSNAAWTSGFTTALRLLLCLPRAPEQIRIRAPEGLEPPPDLEDGPRETQRVVLREPVLQHVQEQVDRAQLEAGAQALLVDLARLRGGKLDHQTLRAGAGLPLRGPLTAIELRRYTHHLAELVRHEPEPPTDPPPDPDPPQAEGAVVDDRPMSQPEDGHGEG